MLEREEDFSILVYIDGTEGAVRALRYAARIGAGTDGDLTLLYVRPLDRSVAPGPSPAADDATHLDRARELPGMKALRQARDVLVDLGYLAANWQESFRHTNVIGDPLGDNMIVYTGADGRSITLKLMVSPSISLAILDECEVGRYDIVIVAKPDGTTSPGPGAVEPDIAETVAIEHNGTVLVARSLEESHGHLVCVTNAEESVRAARRDARIAARCACPVYLLSVAANRAELPAAERALDDAERAIEGVGVRISGRKAVVGDPVAAIIEEGRSYSVIVLSAARRRTGWRRFFTISTAYRVLQNAHNSVMIAR